MSEDNDIGTEIAADGPSREDVRLSRFLSFVLRHGPDSIGLVLDRNGWAEVGELIRKAKSAKRVFGREDLLRVVAGNDKARFTLSPDGRKIRAAQGHSVEVDLGLKPSEPPALLFHGTATRFLKWIMEQGLKPKERHQVHLSADETVAWDRAGAYGTPCLIDVDAAAMRAEGLPFYRADNGVWLTDLVAPRFILPQVP
jgi:putative RNA 2'-phosphotransferase